MTLPTRTDPFPPPPLQERLERLARTPVLLVASDFDGTIAPIVDDPTAARPQRESVVALRTLAELPQTHVAVISGRALRDLSGMLGDPGEIHLIGSHGGEFDLGFARSLAPERQDLLQQVHRELAEIAETYPGAALEVKPASVAFHYRHVDPGRASAVTGAISAGPGSWDGVSTKHGKSVLELAVVETDKGAALNLFRRRAGATAVLFLGDDVTDEDAFVHLSGPDVGIKVGEGETAAGFRVRDPNEVARILADLAELRAGWAYGDEAVAIEDHSMLSDLRTGALVTPTGRITWYCAPRFDSPPLFAELLGGPNAGFFAVGPSGGGAPNRQAYDPDAMLLRTEWPGLTATDYMDLSAARALHRPGRSDLVRVLEGEGAARIEFAPRLDFGRVPTRMTIKGDALVVEDTLEPVVLYAPGVRWRLDETGPHQTAVGEADLSGGAVMLDLRFGTANVEPTVQGEAARRQETTAFWRAWGADLRLPGVATEAVRRSAMVLKALTFGPTGGILAAATTSLPEAPGGIRNWDYRYVWLRDGAMAAEALARLGSYTEAFRFLDWVLGLLDSLDGPEQLRPLYTVSGHRLGPEAEIGELSGYAGSRPVRIGNAASHQVQLDVFGPIVQLIACLLQEGAPVTTEHWRLAEAMVQAVERRWHEPDHGIWEVRDRRRHYTHSKVMCWLTVDRALAVARQLMNRDVPRWRALRDEIAADVLARAWHPGLNSFAADYERGELDAAVLMIGLSGLVSATDPRFAGTVDAVEQTLRRGPAVWRYRYDDGLPGEEGGFLLCTSWLVDALLLLGRVDAARELFEGLLERQGATGLMAEEVDPTSGRGLGNVPQAYSHTGLIMNALHLDKVVAAG